MAGVYERFLKRQAIKQQYVNEQFSSSVQRALHSLDIATNSSSRLTESVDPSSNTKGKVISPQPGQVYYTRTPDNPNYFRTVFVNRNNLNGGIKVQVSNPVYGDPAPGTDELSPEQVLRMMNQAKQSSTNTLNALQQPSSFQTDQYKRWSGEAPTEAEEQAMDIDVTESVSTQKAGREFYQREKEEGSMDYKSPRTKAREKAQRMKVDKSKGVVPREVEEGLSPEQQKGKSEAQSKVSYYQQKAKDGPLSAEDRAKFNAAKSRRNSYNRIDVAQQKVDDKKASTPPVRKTLSVADQMKASQEYFRKQNKKPYEVGDGVKRNEADARANAARQPKDTRTANQRMNDAAGYTRKSSNKNTDIRRGD